MISKFHYCFFNKRYSIFSPGKNLQIESFLEKSSKKISQRTPSRVSGKSLEHSRKNRAEKEAVLLSEETQTMRGRGSEEEEENMRNEREKKFMNIPEYSRILQNLQFRKYIKRIIRKDVTLRRI